MFWCRKRFAWMTKKKFSFHFSSERIKLQKFGLSLKWKSPKTARESRIDSLLSSYLTCDQAFLRVAWKSADGGRAKKRSLSVNSSVILCYALSITKNHCGLQKTWFICILQGECRDQNHPSFCKHCCFCKPCWTVSAVPLLKLRRNRESAIVKVLNFIGVIKSVGVNFLPAMLIGGKIRKKQFFLISLQLLSLTKQNCARLRTDSILQCVVLRFLTCCFCLYSRGLTTTTQWTNETLSLSKSMVK